MHDAFDFMQEAEALKNLTLQSKHHGILMHMLQHVRDCSDFIQSYAQDNKFCMLSSSVSLAIVNLWSTGTRFLKNISGQVDKHIEALCANFIKLRKAFLDHAIVSTEITILQILNNVGGISTCLDGVSNQVSGLGM